MPLVAVETPVGVEDVAHLVHRRNRDQIDKRRASPRGVRGKAFRGRRNFARKRRPASGVHGRIVRGRECERGGIRRKGSHWCSETESHAGRRRIAEQIAGSCAYPLRWPDERRRDITSPRSSVTRAFAGVSFPAGRRLFFERSTMQTLWQDVRYGLRGLARVSGEVVLDIKGPATQRWVLDAFEASYSMLRGTIRGHVTQQRLPFLRSSPARRICPMSCRTPRCPTRSRRQRSLC